MQDKVSQTLLRITQEALTNVRLYAQAHSVEVSLNAREDQVDLTVVDDGSGFNPGRTMERAPLEEKFGLIGMHERVREIGGTVAITSSPGRGTAVAVALPRHPKDRVELRK
ncbi:MAG: hypothetical protein HYX89_05045 [Chloroflexi bacterium]|nr:hypothetical protein [Chloroflexota bacterium]